MDIVFIEQLSVITTIGVYDWEQTIEQTVSYTHLTLPTIYSV